MRLLKLLLIGSLIVAAFGGGYLLRDRKASALTAPPARRVLYYVDAMHPAYRSDRPGIAPDCGMPLTPVYADEALPAPTAAARTVLYYRDPKAPGYTATTAGLNPETGNTLEPVYAEAPTALPAGAFHLGADRGQRAGVTYDTVQMTDAGRTLRTVGTVAYDETKVQHVHARVDGWIDIVHVAFTGQLVAAGQPLLTIYSPELLASQEELLLARRAREVMQGSPLRQGAQQGESLFQAARRRLTLWNLTDTQIDQVLATGQPIRAVTLHAPAAGVVLERNAFPNQRVTAESDLYTLVDLRAVWVMADVPESDLADIRPGIPARVLLPQGGDGGTAAATVTYVQPSLDPATRTMKVRLEVRNSRLRLRPGMFVDVEFPLAGTRRLTVPVDAVLDTGERKVVFVDLGDGYLAQREIQTGEQVGGRVVVTSGLAEGQRVVASGTFLIDAESRLRSGAGHGHD
jgi:Cu(I)/Ag(I) efflux system membrane fusion protein